MKNLKKNQIVIFVIALMLVTAGYLNFANEKNGVGDLQATSSLADSEQMAAIGDAKLVNANETQETQNVQTASNVVENTNAQNEVMENNVENEKDVEPTNTLANEYFTQSRLDRDNMYSQMIENYQKILSADNVSQKEQETAQNEIKRINNEKNAIMIAENLIKTKEFNDVVIFVNNGNVSVIVGTDSLNENQIAQIQNIVTRELNVAVNKINVGTGPIAHF